MKGTIKRVVSILLALAMVVTSLNYTPSSVKAADYSGLIYTDINDNQNTEFDQGLKGCQYSAVTGSVMTAKFQNRAYGELYFAVAGISASNLTITLNGQSIATVAGTEIHIYNAVDYLTYMYNVLDITSDGGNAQIIIKNPNKTGTYGETEEPSSSEEGSSETPTATEKPDETVTETESSELNWQTNANLTAACGEGARFAVVGELPGGNYSINADNINITTGSFGTSMIVTLNGTELWNGAYAMGLSIPYTKMVAGVNTIQADGVHNTDGNVSMTIYVDIPMQSLNLYVNDYASSTGKYIVKFDEVDSAVSYKVYIDGTSTDITLGGSGDYINYSELSAFGEGNHSLTLSAVYEDSTETTQSKSVTINKPATAGTNTEIPQIYIQTDDTSIQPLSIQKSQGNLNSSITVLDNEGGQNADIFEDGAKTTLKVRGNSTANADKKAFNIKFTNTQNVFGFGEAKKWSLLANAFDKSLVRNKIAMDFATNVAGVPYNSRSRYVDLYLNGRYMGNYLCIESVETGKTRVDINAEGTKDDGGNVISDALLELDSDERDRPTDGHLFNPDNSHPTSEETNGTTAGKAWLDATSVYGIKFAVNAPEMDPSKPAKYIEATTKYADKMRAVYGLLTDFENALEGGNYETIAQYIDVDSFVNFYIVNEFFKNQDINFSSTRFYTKNGKLYAGPCWDFDLSSGNVSIAYYTEAQQAPQGFKATEFKWYEKLMSNATFKEKVVARYQELLPSIRALFADGGTIDQTVSEISGSAARNYTSVEKGGAGWSLNTKDSGDGYSNANTITYDNYASYISDFKTWVTAREAFLTSKWLGEEGFTYTSGTEEGTLADNVDGLNNYVRYKNVSATATSAHAGNLVEYAIDNNKDTRWESAQKEDPQELVVDLGATYSVKELLIRWHAANAKNFTVEVSTDGVAYETVATITDAESIDNRLDTITLTNAVSARYIKINGTARNMDSGYSIYELGIYGPDAQKEAETTTVVETTTTPSDIPEDATWTLFPNAQEYYYYVPAESNGKCPKDGSTDRGTDLYVLFDSSTVASASLDGTTCTVNGNIGVAVNKTLMTEKNRPYKLIATYNDNTTATIYLKYMPAPKYDPLSLVTTVDRNATPITAHVTWTQSDDARNAGCTYTVKIGTLDAVPVDANVTSADIDISSLSYDKYDVTVNAILDGEVVGTTAGTLSYKDLDVVDSTVTFDTSKWEYDRSEGIQWTKVENAVGYAIYVDGKLYQTINNPDTLSIDVPAYAFANSENANRQKTTVGTHTTAIVALMNGDAVENALENMNAKRIMDSNSFPLYVNYVFGNQTDIWNNTGVDSVWNFTLCESADDPNITRGANVKVTYNKAGAADLVFNDMGKHAGKDQAWTVKAAIYNQPITNGELQNLSFDIYGPATLVGQNIMIHCFAEEWDRENNRYGEAIYDDPNVAGSLYTFKATEDGKAVLHYSTSFTAKSDTYDLVFGLGLLNFKDSTDKSILLTDSVSKKVYGLTSLTPSPVVNTSNINNSSIFVSWQTDVPNHLESEYTYNVYIDGNPAKLPDEETAYKNNMTFAGYGPGEHTVKVESIYNGAITSTQEKTVTIENHNKPDLVVTDISIPDGEYHIGEEVTISVTVKNIGTAKAEGYGDLAIFAYVGENYLGYQFAHHGETGLEHTLDVGESYTAQYKYTISKEDEKGGYLFNIKAIVDGYKYYAAHESNPNNNSYTKTFKFYEPISTPTITNAGDHVKIDWNDHDDTNKNFIVSYTVEGESEPRTIETVGNISEIDLPTDVWLASGSQVIVTSVHTDGSSHVYSIGTALPDLVISKVDIPKNAYAVGEVVPIKVTMKNVGVSTAIPTKGNNNLTIKPTKDGNILETNVTPLYRYMEEDGLEQKLLVGEEYSYTFNYTVQQADKDAGSIQLGGMADAEGNVTELDNENNITEVSLKIMDKGTLTLTSNNGEGPVSATWTAADENLVNGYKLKYTTDGTNYIEVPIYTTTTAEHEANVTYDENTGKYTYTFPAEVGLYNQSDVTVMVTFDEVSESATYYDFASDTAMVDLIITKVVGPNESSQPVKVKVNFDLTATVKNIGTAVIAPSTADLEGYGRHLFVTLIEQTGVPQKTSEGFYHGLTVGSTTDISLKDVVINEPGKKDLVIMADHAGWYIDGDTSKPAGYIPESDETNNKFTYSVTAIIDQQPMDWTPLTVAQDSTEIYEFKIAQGTKDAHVEFKVVDTNNKELDYKDIVTKYIGYSDKYMSLGFNPNYSAIVVKKDDEEGKIISTVPYWAAITKKQVNSNIHDLATCSIMDVEGWDIDGIDAVTGKAVQKAKVPGTHFNADGNGFNMNIDDFDINSHYLLKLYNANRDYVTLAFRVTDKYGNIGDWTQATGKNMDNDAIPFYYHDMSCETTGGFYYNKNDIKLSNIAAYNGNYISVDLDTQYKINANNHKIIIARGLIDSDGDMITPLPDGTVDGTETGSYYSCTGDLIDVNSAEYYANETNYVVPEVYGINGNNKFQIMLPTLMKEIPIHSELGGQKDNEYYYMKIFWDEDEHPDEYVSIPIRVTANIPQIEDVYGLSVTNRGSSLSVSWTNTTSQSAHGYLYDLYIDDVLVEENVEAGSYNFTGYSTIGKTYTVRVVAKWCEQTAEQSMAYKIQEPETEPEETIPSDTPDIPKDEKWVLINGQNTLPISIDGTIDSTTNAQIYYYTDVDMKSVIGYNDYYIALNGSDKYFTGTDTKIYVQREGSTTFTSKNVYDSYYKGQTLMNAAKMFSVPNDYTTDKTYYYVVRVAGNNGNTYKDFYFKVVPTSEAGTVTNTGAWRLISGESELPVKMGTSSKLMGTVGFLDCPNTTETYTGTNTYDIVGYNGYYMSIIGSNIYYTGEDTKISVSNASSSVLYAENAEDLTFTEKPIYDKVWPGQIIIKCEDTFTVEYAKTYYLLKVESGENVTYIPVEITVKTGEVEVLGFQMNTNQNEGAVAEKSPSFRVVSKTSNVMTINNKLHEVKKMGTVYALADQVKNLETQMNLDAVESNEYVAHLETTDKGKLTGYTTTESDTNYNTYFALTFIYKSYMYHTLEQNYAFRAYAVLDDGTVVYGHNIYTTNMYEIAQNLYDNQKMGTKDAHDFLYKNILNLVDMDKNSSKIANAMFKAMGVKGTNDARYDLVAKMTTDIYNYARCRDGYTYKGREQFKCKNVEAELLRYLNDTQTEKEKATYESVYDWIYNETSNYSNKSGVPYKGCYRLVEYGWDSTIDDDFHTE